MEKQFGLQDLGGVCSVFLWLIMIVVVIIVIFISVGYFVFFQGVFVFGVEMYNIYFMLFSYVDDDIKCGI